FANTNDTLIFYMATKHLFALDELLLRYTHKPNTPLAVVEQATTIHQRIHITTLKNCTRDFAAKTFSSPSLVIVGKVVGLHDQFKWFKSEIEGTVFNELPVEIKA